MLLVAGNENLPNGQPNPWNKVKSRALLQFYGEDDGYESDPNNEYTAKSSARRLRVAKALGITRAQLNFAQLDLWFVSFSSDLQIPLVMFLFPQLLDKYTSPFNDTLYRIYLFALPLTKIRRVP